MSITATFPTIRARHESLNREALRDVFKDQQADVVVAGRPLSSEWDDRLARTLFARNQATATSVGVLVAKAFKKEAEFDPSVMDAWLTKNAEFGARAINNATRAALAGAEDKAPVFEVLLASGAARYAASMVTTAANFGAVDAAAKVGGIERTKTWIGSGSPQSRHTAVSGETVPLSSNFSNGLAWPGDPSGSGDDLVNCGCSVQFN